MQSLQSNERAAFYKVQMFTTESKIPARVCAAGCVSLEGVLISAEIKSR
jgi:hypothetical protein